MRADVLALQRGALRRRGLQSAVVERDGLSLALNRHAARTIEHKSVPSLYAKSLQAL